MDLKMYCSMYHEFLKLFIHLGKAIKFAFSGKFHKTYSKIEMLTILFFIFRYQWKGYEHVEKLGHDDK